MVSSKQSPFSMVMLPRSVRESLSSAMKHDAAELCAWYLVWLPAGVGHHVNPPPAGGTVIGTRSSWRNRRGAEEM